MARPVPLRWRALALAIAALACAAPSREPAAAASLRVATWNVENLFDERDEPGRGDTPVQPAEVARKLERLGAVLRKIDADVVVLQEVENVGLLERLASGPLAGRGYRPRLVDGLDPRGIDVALLSRVPVERYVSHAADRDASGAPLWSRDLVEAHLRVGGRHVVAFGAHLVSRRDPTKGPRRASQARRARALADDAAARWPDALILVAGDLNDEPSSAALAPLLADGAWADLGGRLPPDRAWTWAGLGTRVRLDYLLVPRRSAAAAVRVQVWDGEDVRAASDHRPLVADLVLR
jgi:endonuclease/exonuclease/phosphatase family metal-dependent hydrolase